MLLGLGHVGFLIMCGGQTTQRTEKNIWASAQRKELIVLIHILGDYVVSMNI